MRLHKHEPRIFLIAVLLSLSAHAPSLVSPTFSVDDLWYWPAKFDYDSVGFIAFSEGRFTAPFLAYIENALGFNASLAFTLGSLMMITSLAVSAVLLCRLWKIENDFWASALVVALLVVHPYQADFFTWKLAQLNGGLPFVMTLSALVIAPLGAWQFFLAVCLVVAAFGIHQIPLEFAAAAMVMAVPICLVNRNFQWRDWSQMVLALSAGTLLYVLLANLTIMQTAHSGGLGRDRIVLFSNPGLVWSRLIELIRLFSIADPLIGWLSRIILAVLLFYSLCAILLMKLSLGRRILILGCLMGGLFAAFVCAVSLSVVSSAWIPVFRNLVALSLLWAAVALIAFLLSGQMMKRVVTAFVCLPLIGFVGASNVVLSDQQRANQRDVSLMNRITVDIEKLPNYPTIRRVLFIGANTSPLARLSTGSDVSFGWHQYGTTLSAFSVPWPGYLVRLFNEVNGGSMGYDATDQELASANSYCESRRWPEPGSVAEFTNLAVVCLSPPVKGKPSPFDHG